MKKVKSKKTDNLRLLASVYLAAVARNLEYIEQIKKYEGELKRLTSSNNVLTTEPGNRKYNIKLKMYLDREEKVFDFTDIVQLIQYNSPELLVKILRQVHHNYSIMNINEMTAALNRKELSLATYSEDIPNELHYLKALADSIEAIKEIDTSTQTV